MAKAEQGDEMRTKAEYIDKLAKDYPGLRIAYVDIAPNKVNYSVLLK